MIDSPRRGFFLVLFFLPFTVLIGAHGTRLRRKGYDFAADVGTVVEIVHENFSCEGRAYGYYADQTLDCKVFHICSPIETQSGGRVKIFMFSFFCPDKTIFSQDSKTCIAEKVALPCKRAHTLYNLNKSFGQEPSHNREKGLPSNSLRSNLHINNVIPGGSGVSGNPEASFEKLKSPSHSSESFRDPQTSLQSSIEGESRGSRKSLERDGFKKRKLDAFSRQGGSKNNELTGGLNTKLKSHPEENISEGRKDIPTNEYISDRVRNSNVNINHRRTQEASELGNSEFNINRANSSELLKNLQTTTSEQKTQGNNESNFPARFESGDIIDRDKEQNLQGTGPSTESRFGTDIMEGNISQRTSKNNISIQQEVHTKENNVKIQANDHFERSDNQTQNANENTSDAHKSSHDFYDETVLPSGQNGNANHDRRNIDDDTFKDPESNGVRKVNIISKHVSEVRRTLHNLKAANVSTNVNNVGVENFHIIDGVHGEYLTLAEVSTDRDSNTNRGSLITTKRKHDERVSLEINPAIPKFSDTTQGDVITQKAHTQNNPTLSFDTDFGPAEILMPPPPLTYPFNETNFDFESDLGTSPVSNGFTDKVLSNINLFITLPELRRGTNKNVNDHNDKTFYNNQLEKELQNIGESSKHQDTKNGTFKNIAHGHFNYDIADTDRLHNTDRNVRDHKSKVDGFETNFSYHTDNLDSLGELDDIDAAVPTVQPNMQIISKRRTDRRSEGKRRTSARQDNSQLIKNNEGLINTNLSQQSPISESVLRSKSSSRQRNRPTSRQQQDIIYEQGEKDLNDELKQSSEISSHSGNSLDIQNIEKNQDISNKVTNVANEKKDTDTSKRQTNLQGQTIKAHASTISADSQNTFGTNLAKHTPDTSRNSVAQPQTRAITTEAIEHLRASKLTPQKKKRPVIATPVATVSTTTRAPVTRTLTTSTSKPIPQDRGTKKFEPSAYLLQSGFFKFRDNQSSKPLVSSSLSTSSQAPKRSTTKIFRNENDSINKNKRIKQQTSEVELNKSNMFTTELPDPIKTRKNIQKISKLLELPSLSSPHSTENKLQNISKPHKKVSQLRLAKSKTEKVITSNLASIGDFSNSNIQDTRSSPEPKVQTNSSFDVISNSKHSFTGNKKQTNVTVNENNKRTLTNGQHGNRVKGGGKPIAVKNDVRTAEVKNIDTVQIGPSVDGINNFEDSEIRKSTTVTINEQNTKTLTNGQLRNKGRGRTKHTQQTATTDIPKQEIKIDTVETGSSSDGISSFEHPFTGIGNSTSVTINKENEQTSINGQYRKRVRGGRRHQTSVIKEEDNLAFLGLKDTIKSSPHMENVHEASVPTKMPKERRVKVTVNKNNVTKTIEVTIPENIISRVQNTKDANKPHSKISQDSEIINGARETKLAVPTASGVILINLEGKANNDSQSKGNLNQDTNVKAEGMNDKVKTSNTLVSKNTNNLDNVTASDLRTVSDESYTKSNFEKNNDLQQLKKENNTRPLNVSLNDKHEKQKTTTVFNTNYEPRNGSKKGQRLSKNNVSEDSSTPDKINGSRKTSQNIASRGLNEENRQSFHQGKKIQTTDNIWRNSEGNIPTVTKTGDNISENPVNESIDILNLQTLNEQKGISAKGRKIIRSSNVSISNRNSARQRTSQRNRNTVESNSNNNSKSQKEVKIINDTNTQKARNKKVSKTSIISTETFNSSSGSRPNERIKTNVSANHSAYSRLQLNSKPHNKVEIPELTVLNENAEVRGTKGKKVLSSSSAFSEETNFNTKKISLHRSRARVSSDSPVSSQSEPENKNESVGNADAGRTSNRGGSNNVQTAKLSSSSNATLAKEKQSKITITKKNLSNEVTNISLEKSKLQSIGETTNETLSFDISHVYKSDDKQQVTNRRSRITARGRVVSLSPSNPNNIQSGRRSSRQRNEKGVRNIPSEGSVQTRTKTTNLSETSTQSVSQSGGSLTEIEANSKHVIERKRASRLSNPTKGRNVTVSARMDQKNDNHKKQSVVDDKKKLGPQVSSRKISQRDSSVNVSVIRKNSNETNSKPNISSTNVFEKIGEREANDTLLYYREHDQNISAIPNEQLKLALAKNQSFGKHLTRNNHSFQEESFSKNDLDHGNTTQNVNISLVKENVVGRRRVRNGRVRKIVNGKRKVTTDIKDEKRMQKNKTEDISQRDVKVADENMDKNEEFLSDKTVAHEKQVKKVVELTGHAQKNTTSETDKKRFGHKISSKFNDSEIVISRSTTGPSLNKTLHEDESKRKIKQDKIIETVTVTSRRGQRRGIVSRQLSNEARSLESSNINRNEQHENLKSSISLSSTPVRTSSRRASSRGLRRISTSRDKQTSEKKVDSSSVNPSSETDEILSHATTPIVPTNTPEISPRQRPSSKRLTTLQQRTNRIKNGGDVHDRKFENSNLLNPHNEKDSAIDKNQSAHNTSSVIEETRASPRLVSNLSRGRSAKQRISSLQSRQRISLSTNDDKQLSTNNNSYDPSTEILNSANTAKQNKISTSDKEATFKEPLKTSRRQSPRIRGLRKQVTSTIVELENDHANNITNINEAHTNTEDKNTGPTATPSVGNSSVSLTRSANLVTSRSRIANDNARTNGLDNTDKTLNENPETSSKPTNDSSTTKETLFSEKKVGEVFTRRNNLVSQKRTSSRKVMGKEKATDEPDNTSQSINEDFETSTNSTAVNSPILEVTSSRRSSNSGLTRKNNLVSRQRTSRKRLPLKEERDESPNNLNKKFETSANIAINSSAQKEILSTVRDSNTGLTRQNLLSSRKNRKKTVINKVATDEQDDVNQRLNEESKTFMNISNSSVPQEDSASPRGSNIGIKRRNLLSQQRSSRKKVIGRVEAKDEQPSNGTRNEEFNTSPNTPDDSSILKKTSPRNSNLGLTSGNNLASRRRNSRRKVISQGKANDEPNDGNIILGEESETSANTTSENSSVLKETSSFAKTSSSRLIQRNNLLSRRRTSRTKTINNKITPEVNTETLKKDIDDSDAGNGLSIVNENLPSSKDGGLTTEHRQRGIRRRIISNKTKNREESADILSKEKTKVEVKIVNKNAEVKSRSRGFFHPRTSTNTTLINDMQSSPLISNTTDTVSLNNGPVKTPSGKKKNEISNRRLASIDSVLESISRKAPSVSTRNTNVQNSTPSNHQSNHKVYESITTPLPEKDLIRSDVTVSVFQTLKSENQSQKSRSNVSFDFILGPLTTTEKSQNTYGQPSPPIVKVEPPKLFDLFTTPLKIIEETTPSPFDIIGLTARKGGGTEPFIIEPKNTEDSGEDQDVLYTSLLVPRTNEKLYSEGITQSTSKSSSSDYLQETVSKHSLPRYLPEPDLGRPLPKSDADLGYLPLSVKINNRNEETFMVLPDDSISNEFTNDYYALDKDPDEYDNNNADDDDDIVSRIFSLPKTKEIKRKRIPKNKFAHSLNTPLYHRQPEDSTGSKLRLIGTSVRSSVSVSKEGGSSSTSNFPIFETKPSLSSDHIPLTDQELNSLKKLTSSNQPSRRNDVKTENFRHISNFKAR